MLYFYPEDFGALGNGVNNDCQSIQSAIDKAEENIEEKGADTQTEEDRVDESVAAQEKADGEEKIRLIESQLQDSTQIIVDIYSRFLFEDEVIRRRKSTFLFAKDLEEIMINAQKESYGDGLDPEALL